MQLTRRSEKCSELSAQLRENLMSFDGSIPKVWICIWLGDRFWYTVRTRLAGNACLQLTRRCICTQKWGKTKALRSLWNVCFCWASYPNHLGDVLLFSHSTRVPSHAYFTVYPKCAWLVVASCCACVGICRHVCLFHGGQSR